MNKEEKEQMILVSVPVKRKQYYAADIMRGLLSPKGEIVFRKGNNFFNTKCRNLKDLHNFIKIVKMMMRKRRSKQNE